MSKKQAYSIGKNGFLLSPRIVGVAMTRPPRTKKDFNLSCWLLHELNEY